MGHGLKAEGKEELSEEGRWRIKPTEGQGRGAWCSGGTATVRQRWREGWKWEARTDFHGAQDGCVKVWRGHKGVRSGAVSRPGPGWQALTSFSL